MSIQPNSMAHMQRAIKQFLTNFQLPSAYVQKLQYLHTAIVSSIFDKITLHIRLHLL